MAQLAQCFGFDLADAFAGYGEALADFFQSVFAAVFEAEAHFDYFFFARRQRAQDLSSLVLEVHVDHGFGRRDYGAVFNEVAEMRIFFFADRSFERDRFLRDLQNLANFRDGNIHSLRDFFRCRFATELLHQLPRGADQLVDGLDHVDRDTNRTRLISNCTSNCLPNPPRGISRKLIPAAIFEFVDSLHQADVAFLNQVEELQAALGVLGVHVALDDLALRALEFLEQQTRFHFKLFELSANRARLLLVFLFLLFAARCLGPLFQILDLAVERAHAVNRAVYTVDQAFAFVVGEAEFTYRD